MDGSFPQNEIITIITIGIILMLLLAVAFVLFFYFSQRKFQTQQMAAQQRELEHQQQLLHSNIQAQEEERKRIARELHDEVGSKLNVMNLGLHRLKKKTGGQGIMGDTLDELFSVVGTTIDTTRRISHDLLPPTLENFGLSAALDELCEAYRKASEVEVVFELCQNDESVTDLNLSLGIFRVVQELMSNSFKHGHPNHIDVKLWQVPTEIRLTYKEDGKGFDLTKAMNQKGLGMKNIESRLQMIGAEHQIESMDGKGVFFQIKKQLL